MILIFLKKRLRVPRRVSAELAMAPGPVFPIVGRVSGHTHTHPYPYHTWLDRNQRKSCRLFILAPSLTIADIVLLSILTAISYSNPLLC